MKSNCDKRAAFPAPASGARPAQAARLLPRDPCTDLQHGTGAPIQSPGRGMCVSSLIPDTPSEERAWHSYRKMWHT